MSLRSLIATGLTEKQWRELFDQLMQSPKRPKDWPIVTFDEWKAEVIAEGENRKFIEYCYSGKQIGVRKGIAKVIAEIKKDWL
jgi:hypothetical protein